MTRIGIISDTHGLLDIEIDGASRRAWHVPLDERSKEALVSHMNQLCR